MLGVGTKVLVRYLVADDAAQFDKARRLIRRETAAGRSVMVSQLVLLETEWVLRSRYDLDKVEIADVFGALLDAADVALEDEAAIEEALYLWRDASADFADCLIGARNRRLGCTATATFDARAARLPGFIKA